MPVDGISLREFVKGGFDSIWNPDQGELDAVKTYADYMARRQVWSRDDEFLTNGKYFVDPSQHFIAYLCESIDIRPLLDYPDLPCFTNDESCPFYPESSGIDLSEDERVFKGNFPYTVVTTDYFGSLDRKKRWKFKDSLKTEAEVDIFPVEKFSRRDVDFYVNTTRKKFGEETEPICSLKSIQVLKKQVNYYRILEGKELVGVASVVESNPGIWYVYIFTSTKPCLYNFHKYLVGSYPLGSIIHYGAKSSWRDENAERVFTYKSNLANRNSISPFIAIADEPEEISPPYYDLNNKKWVKVEDE